MTNKSSALPSRNGRDPILKERLFGLTNSEAEHPGGQIPAYEWNFSDVNPPVHAWAAIFLYRTEQALEGTSAVPFLEYIFGKLLLNYS